MSFEFDVFVSHASDDKARFVDSFVAALEARGLRVWYDSNEIRLGDDFVRRMNEGLSQSRFGLVILSPNYFKFWPEAELSALFNQEATFDQTRRQSGRFPGGIFWLDAENPDLTVAWGTTIADALGVGA